MGEIIQQEGTGSTLEHVKLHRTKATALCKNVIAPAIAEDLKQHLINKPFSILTDEATDSQSKKHLAVIVRVYDPTMKEHVDYLLGIVGVIFTTGADLFNAITGIQV